MCIRDSDETMWEQMGNVATHIMQGNKVTSKEAARAAVPDELYERVGAEVPNMVDMAKRAVGNTGAIPVDPNDRPL